MTRFKLALDTFVEIGYFFFRNYNKMVVTLPYCTERGITVVQQREAFKIVLLVGFNIRPSV